MLRGDRPGEAPGAGEGPRRPRRSRMAGLHPSDFGPYIEARTGDKIQPTRFGVLARDERNSFNSSRTRPVYLGFALTSVRGEAIKRLLVRSDWELERRIVAPRRAASSTSSWPSLLRARRRAGGPRRASGPAEVPRRRPRARPAGRQRSPRQFRPRDAGATSRAPSSSAVLPRDREQRAEAAARLRHRPEHALLFGAPRGARGRRERSQSGREAGTG